MRQIFKRRQHKEASLNAATNVPDWCPPHYHRSLPPYSALGRASSVFVINVTVHTSFRIQLWSYYFGQKYQKWTQSFWVFFFTSVPNESTRGTKRTWIRLSTAGSKLHWENWVFWRNTHWVIFAEGGLCKLNFINKNIFNKHWVLKAR